MFVGAPPASDRVPIHTEVAISVLGVDKCLPVGVDAVPIFDKGVTSPGPGGERDFTSPALDLPRVGLESLDSLLPFSGRVYPARKPRGGFADIVAALAQAADTDVFVEGGSRKVANTQSVPNSEPVVSRSPNLLSSCVIDRNIPTSGGATVGATTSDASTLHARPASVRRCICLPLPNRVV